MVFETGDPVCTETSSHRPSLTTQSSALHNASHFTFRHLYRALFLKVDCNLGHVWWWSNMNHLTLNCQSHSDIELKGQRANISHNLNLTHSQV